MRESSIFRGEKAPLLFGHRGCPQLAPENTIASFKELLSHNVPGVELDLQICASGELVISHDNNMKRTTGFDGLITDHDLSQIRSLDNGSYFSEEFESERIPLLSEAFDLMGKNVYYDIELKAYNAKNLGMEEKVLSMIKDYDLGSKVIVSSFNPISLRRFRKLTSEIPTFLIYSDDDDIPFYLRKGEGRFISKPWGLKPDCRLLDEEAFGKRSRKYPIMSWTVDDEGVFDRLSRWGIEGICSNRADYFVKKGY